MTSVRGHRTFLQIFLAPAVIGGAVAFGLASALLGDGIWDALSWIALLVPAAVVAYYWFFKI